MRAAQLLMRAARKQQQHAAHHYARLRPTTMRAQQPTLKPRGPAAQRVALVAPPTRPGRNLGLGRDSSCPPGLYSARSNSRRQSESDGQASISEDQKPPPTVASLCEMIENPRLDMYSLSHNQNLNIPPCGVNQIF